MNRRSTRLRFIARTRLIARRLRWTIFFAGIAWSAFALGMAIDPAFLCEEFSNCATNAYAAFLITNPPAFAVKFNATGLPTQPELATVTPLIFASCSWWLFLALVLRRRHAKVIAAV